MTDRAFHILTLGCSKNRVDSDGMEHLLRGRGMTAVARPEEAQVVIVNTCGFLGAARDESVAAISELLGQRHDGQFVIAAGCMPALGDYRNDDAIDSLAKSGRAHEDLTPSNIVLRNRLDGGRSVVLIDLGRNYLYTRLIGVHGNVEAKFVAPEVRDDKASSNADIYSAGMLTAELLDPGSALERESSYELVRVRARLGSHC